MNEDNMPADHVEANQWQGMLRDWRALLVWEIVVTVLTLVMVRQHLGLAVTVAVIDLAAVVQTLQVVKTRSTSSVGDTRQRASVTAGLGAAALIALVGAVVAVVTVL
jgi:asparagine N-glycosylation enzyme membrane subunit Stt3